MTAIFNCQGPLDAPIFVGSGMATRKMGPSAFDISASSASEAVAKSKDAGAVAAIDHIPFSYLSANFTFNTDSCVSESEKPCWTYLEQLRYKILCIILQCDLVFLCFYIRRSRMLETPVRSLNFLS